MSLSFARRALARLHVVLASLIALMVGLFLAVPTAPTAAASVGPLVSADFFGGLDAGRWQVVDPVGDAAVSVVGAGTGDARLSIAVPAGAEHDAWGPNESVRVLQPVEDTDVEVAAKFDSVPAGTYADQGLQIHGASGKWLRFGVYSHGPTKLLAFAAATTGTSSTMKLKQEVTAPSGQMWLRVSRSGSQFTFDYSADKQSWTTIGSFTSDLTVTAIGPYSGNSGTNAPAHTAQVDYVFNTASPITPEDGGLDSDGGGDGGGGGDPEDTTAPQITQVQATPRTESAQISWTTDEPTTTQVQYGTDTSYGHTTPPTTTATTNHDHTLTGLTPQTTYHYRITATDTAGNTTTTNDATFTTTEDGPPQIDLWHEEPLTVGLHGTPQPWINVLGNVSDPSGVATLSYSLNGGAERALTIGPDDRRLQALGDFNADIDLADLQMGDNTVVLRATDNDGQTTTVTTTVRRVQATAPALPYTLEWSENQPLQDQATVVDGKWDVVNGAVVSTRLGYDRVIALGDLSWRDYEVKVPFTVSTIGPEAKTGTSGDALVGMAMRWQGHRAFRDDQPAWRYFPVGSYAWLRLYDTWPKLEILGNHSVPSEWVYPDPRKFQFGEPYWMKARVETLLDGTTRYSFKMWLASAGEPASWSLQIVSEGPATGSVGLIAHHVDAAFGTVEVTPL
ncbi:MAG TPA: DUF1349 domain-containing protein [Nocardioidaceae bacterium]|nr:DUF1349 domain-containing protein [Nocardioidaceae bacterium]